MRLQMPSSSSQGALLEGEAGVGADHALETGHARLGRVEQLLQVALVLLAG